MEPQCGVPIRSFALWAFGLRSRPKWGMLLSYPTLSTAAVCHLRYNEGRHAHAHVCPPSAQSSLHRTRMLCLKPSIARNQLCPWVCVALRAQAPPSVHMRVPALVLGFDRIPPQRAAREVPPIAGESSLGPRPPLRLRTPTSAASPLGTLRLMTSALGRPCRHETCCV